MTPEIELCHIAGVLTMKTLSVREMRSALPHLEEIIAKQGEIQITRRGRPFARILPLQAQGKIPSRAAWRATMPKLKVPSEVLIRQDRDER